MTSITSLRPLATACSVILALLCVVPAASAYDQYSQNGGADTTNCAACHGDFRAGTYISNTDGQSWGDIHILHQIMVGGDCDTCHDQGGRFPMILDSSKGGNGLAAIGCVGCHGREEDNTALNPDFPSMGGRGAGLRQHHFVTGTTECAQCHLDADPANYTPVGENVLPEYYVNPGSGHSIPTESCNSDASEDYAGNSEGLDNDGDDVYDTSDSDCNVTTAAPEVAGAIGSGLGITPNPFSTETTLTYDLARRSLVRLEVYDLSGRRVRTLVDGYQDGPGPQALHWDARDDEGRALMVGVYFARLQVDGASSSKTIVLLK